MRNRDRRWCRRRLWCGEERKDEEARWRVEWLEMEERIGAASARTEEILLKREEVSAQLKPMIILSFLLLHTRDIARVGVTSGCTVGNAERRRLVAGCAQELACDGSVSAGAKSSQDRPSSVVVVANRRESAATKIQRKTPMPGC